MGSGAVNGGACASSTRGATGAPRSMAMTNAAMPRVEVWLGRRFKYILPLLALNAPLPTVETLRPRPRETGHSRCRCTYSEKLRVKNLVSAVVSHERD